MANDNARGVEEKVSEAMSEGGASLAIGFYIAAVVLIFGTILVMYGLLGSPDDSKSLGLNINLWWGLITVAFGCVVLGLSYASPRRRFNRDNASIGVPPEDSGPGR